MAPGKTLREEEVTLKKAWVVDGGALVLPQQIFETLLVHGNRDHEVELLDTETQNSFTTVLEVCASSDHDNIVVARACRRGACFVLFRG